MSSDLERLLSQYVQNILATNATEPLQQLLGKVAKHVACQPLELAAALIYLDASIITTCRAAFEATDTEDVLKPVELSLENKAGHLNLLLAANASDLAEADLKKQLVTQFVTALKIPEIQPEKYKMVRYRIEIGHNHQVSIEEIKNLLIDESGVDRSKIGNLDIRSNYTLIDLPPGMPPDIFQLLQTAELKQQPLQIKRVNSARKRPWQRRKFGAQNRPVV
ncbi:MAG: DbpA RNA binding domain-containing protein [Methylococcales bacterium]